MTQQKIPSDLDPTSPLRSGTPKPEETKEDPSTKSFPSLMEGQPTEQEVNASMINPMQLAQMATAGPTNPNAFLAQMQMIQNNMGDVKKQLSQPNLKLSASQKTTIKNKLSSANARLESAHLRMGGVLEEEEEEERKAPGKGPIAHFLGLLTSGIEQLESAKRHVKTVSNDGVLSPADFLTIQIDLAKATQEIEFTGVLLSKTMDGFKQLMSVQI